MVRQDAPSLTLLQQAVKYVKGGGRGPGANLPATIKITHGTSSFLLPPHELWAALRSAGGIHLVCHGARRGLV